MIPELGHFALALAVALATAQAVLPLWGAHRRDARLMAAAPALAIGQLIALAPASPSIRPSSTRAMSASRFRSPSPSLRCWRAGLTHPGGVGCDPGRWVPGAS